MRTIRMDSKAVGGVTAGLVLVALTAMTPAARADDLTGTPTPPVTSTSAGVAAEGTSTETTTAETTTATTSPSPTTTTPTTTPPAPTTPPPTTTTPRPVPPPAVIARTAS